MRVTPIATQATEVLFIESNVSDYQSLMDAATPGTEVHLLDASLDGLAQIANILAGRSGINAIHIVSHGSAGVLNLGALQLTAQSLPEHSATLTAIGSTLNPGADILLYGCDIAQGSVGAAFIDALALVTQADIAASTDSTGAAGLGGNWALEQSTGTIETTAFAPQDFQGVLGNGIILVSASASGAESNGQSMYQSISADGRYVAFYSNSQDLVPGSGGGGGIYIKDTQTGAIILASASASGTSGNGYSSYPRISADGRYVAFESDASNLVPGDTNGQYDIFIKDTQTLAITRVSTSANGTESNGNSGGSSISADGRYVAFQSDASNLVPGDTNGKVDTFVKDTQTGAITRVSTSASGAEGNSDSTYGFSISADGRYVAFASGASNLVPGDTGNNTDVFVKDRQTGAITWVSTSASGAGYGGHSPSISADGRHVAFVNSGIIFIKDTQTGVMTRVSTSSSGEDGNSYSYDPSVSADGRDVAFRSSASNLVPGDTNGLVDIFVKDTQTGVIARVSTSASGVEGSGQSDWYGPSISADGRYVAFSSDANNLVAGVSTQGSSPNVFRANNPLIPGTGTPSITLSPTTTFVMEGDSFSQLLTYIVNLSVASSNPVTVKYATTNGSATSGSDYTSTSGTLSFAAGELSKTISVPVLGDTTVESNETFTLALSNPSGATLGSVVNATATIVDNESQATFGNNIIRVSTSTNGTEGNRDSYGSSGSSISADGRYVAFGSQASNLAPGGNGYGGVFIKDIQTGAITRASTSASGVEANNNSYNPSISVDGRYVAFGSGASNLVPGAASGAGNIFLKDTQTGAITLVSASSSGTEGNSYSVSPSISANGRYVAFLSTATNLVSGDTNGQGDIFIKDTQTGTIARVSTSASGVEANSSSYNPSISADGRYVAFRSDSSNLVPNDTNGATDIFVKEIQTGAITRVSTGASGAEGNAYSLSPSISANGRYVAFDSYASNLVPGDTNDRNDVFVKDIQTGAITRVSTSASGAEGNAYSTSPSLSADGRYVAFMSRASNLVPGDTNATWDIFVKDTQTGAIARVSTSIGGTEASSGSGNPIISADGRYITFNSAAGNLVTGDSGINTDVFRVNNPFLITPAVTLSPTTIASITEGDSGSQSLSFTVRLSAATTSAVTVNYATANGTATAGSDYVATSGTLGFAPGETSKTITVPILGDTAVESDETFTLALSSPSGATLGGASSATATIVENDKVGTTITLSPTTASITEGDSGSQSLTFTVSLSAAETSAVTVNYATANGTATAGSDYVATSGTLGFAPGETSKTITVPILGDTSAESNETFTLTLSNPSGAALGSAVSATATIVDNDAATLPPASVSGTASNDFVVPSVGNATYFGGAGSDTYIINSHILSSAVTVTIVDTEGANVIQLNDGLTIASSTFYNNAVQLTLSTGANVRVLGASGFIYQVGANILTGDTASSQTYAQFAATLGASVPTGSTPVSGTSNFVVPTSASAAAQMMAGEDSTTSSVTLVGLTGIDATLESGMLII